MALVRPGLPYRFPLLIIEMDYICSRASFAVLSSFTLLFLATLGAGPLLAQNDNSQFIEGKIHITLPVKAQKTKDGAIAERSFNDGGTRMFTIVDAKGKTTDVYIDHRIDKKDSWGTIYVNAYPDDPGSVRVKDQTLFRKEILAPVGEE